MGQPFYQSPPLPVTFIQNILHEQIVHHIHVFRAEKFPNRKFGSGRKIDVRTVRQKPKRHEKEFAEKEMAVDENLFHVTPLGQGLENLARMREKDDFRIRVRIILRESVDRGGSDTPRSRPVSIQSRVYREHRRLIRHVFGSLRKNSGTPRLPRGFRGVREPGTGSYSHRRQRRI